MTGKERVPVGNRAELSDEQVAAEAVTRFTPPEPRSVVVAGGGDALARRQLLLLLLQGLLAALQVGDGCVVEVGGGQSHGLDLAGLA